MALHQSCRIGNLLELQQLITEGADVNEKDNYGETLRAASLAPLHIASKCGHLDIVKELIQHGADVNDKDDMGWTPLHNASCDGYLEIP